MAVIHLRILGYALTLAMHGYNLYMLNEARNGPAMKDPSVRKFTELYLRFFTVWTKVLLIVHAVLGLTCDCLTLKHQQKEAQKKVPQLLSLLKSFKDRVFAAVLWPTVFLTSSLFWSLYTYDRSLIFPLFADKMMTRTANHIVHTAVIPVVVWELVFQPRVVPKSHSLNITLLSVYMVAYLSLMYYTYIDLGVWMYPVFGIAHDIHIIYFALIIAFIGVMLFIYYHMQWILTRMVWGSINKIKNK